MTSPEPDLLVPCLTVHRPLLRILPQNVFLSRPRGSPQHRLPNACPQVQEGLQALKDRREQVFQAWDQKQERLQATHQEQLFLRKCGHLEETLTAQEAGALTPTHTS